MDHARVFGSMLAKARNDLGKTRKQMADQLGVAAGNIAHWEIGERLPPETRMPMMAQVYKLSEQKLLEGLNLAKAEESFGQKSKWGKKRRVDDYIPSITLAIPVKEFKEGWQRKFLAKHYY